VEQQLRRLKETYGAPYTSPPPDPAEDRAPQRANMEAPRIPEPKRLKGKPSPVWSKARGQWTPTIWYGKTSYHYRHLYEGTKALGEEEANNVPLPTLKVE
jgi:hypothetical protein